MKSTYSSGHLHNHLDPAFHMPDDEFEQKRFDYENEVGDGGKRGKLARGAGLIILLLVMLFILQRYFLPIGPDLTSIFRAIPLTGAVLVLVIGLGLLTRARSVRRRDMSAGWRLKEEESAFADSDAYAHAASGEGEETDTSQKKRSAEEKKTASGKGKKGTKSASAGKSSEEYASGDHHDDPYGYEMHRKWYRSREEKMLFGVCGGIAERLEMDPTIVRALFALAFLSYGFSLVIYVLLAVLLPKKPQHSLL